MHFIGKLQEITEEEMIPHSITNMSHRGVPCQLQAIKNSYRMYSLSALKRVLEDQTVTKLSPTVAFRNLEPVNLEHGRNLTMKRTNCTC